MRATAGADGLPVGAEAASVPQSRELAPREAPLARSATVRRASDLGQHRHVPGAGGVDGGLRRGVDLRERRPQAVLRLGPRPRAEVQLGGRQPDEGRPRGLLGAASARGVSPALPGDRLRVYAVSLVRTPIGFAQDLLGRSRQVGDGVSGRLGPRHDVRADVAPLVHRHQRARRGLGEDVVDLRRPVGHHLAQDDAFGPVQPAGPVRRLAASKPRSFAAAVVPLSSMVHPLRRSAGRPHRGATPTLPARGGIRPADLYRSSPAVSAAPAAAPGGSWRGGVAGAVQRGRAAATSGVIPILDTRAGRRASLAERF